MFLLKCEEKHDARADKRKKVTVLTFGHLLDHGKSAMITRQKIE